MPSISVQSLSNFILKNVTFTVHDGECLVLLGPNGAGKSTVLNIIAGLAGYDGSIFFDSHKVDHMCASRRRVGYVFQEHALFPHLTVRSNVAYGLKRQSKHNKWTINQKVASLLGLVNISHLAGRYPRDLSGGEKQRVALARAIAPGPAVLLMDEPFSSLDLRSAKYLRTEFRQLQRKLHTTTIFVTHNLDEAAEVADRVAFIERGQIMQIGTADGLLFHPAAPQISRFIGNPNILSCDEYHAIENGLAIATCGRLHVVAPYEEQPVHKIAIAPEHVYVSTEPPAGPHINRYQGVVRHIYAENALTRIAVDVHGQPIIAELPSDVAAIMDLSPGNKVYVILKLRWLRLLSGQCVNS